MNCCMQGIKAFKIVIKTHKMADMSNTTTITNTTTVLGEITPDLNHGNTPKISKKEKSMETLKELCWSTMWQAYKEDRIEKEDMETIGELLQEEVGRKQRQIDEEKEQVRIKQILRESDAGNEESKRIMYGLSIARQGEILENILDEIDRENIAINILLYGSKLGHTTQAWKMLTEARKERWILRYMEQAAKQDLEWITSDVNLIWRDDLVDKFRNKFIQHVNFRKNIPEEDLPYFKEASRRWEWFSRREHSERKSVTGIKRKRNETKWGDDEENKEW